MRKKMRDEILDILNTVADGVDYSMKVTETEAENLLSDCYAGLTSIAEVLESNLSYEQGEYYNNSITKMKNILEIIYAALNEGKRDNKSKKLFLLEMSKLKNDLKNESEVKLEIVFMPYKSSMWDSMESIWAAAKADKKCDVYVIPIPYCDRDEDGGGREAHYEGLQFPSDLQVIDYRTYNLAERQPDVIYIHNPYDGNNYVTSVDPLFYSSELKKYTETLVYVPYFINFESYEHFVLLPGVLNADYVMLQSKMARDIYIKKISEYIPVNKDKFVAIGSPKTDRILKQENGKISMPDRWKWVLEGKSANCKVVFYNTHLNPLMQKAELALDNLERVLNTFKERDDVVLIWRPHPLSKSTLLSMNKQYYSRYIEIEQKYLEEKYGVYDESEDYYDAMMCSDMYLGDSSSLLTLYGLTGKMIVKQDIAKKEGFLLQKHNFCMLGKNIWFYSDNMRGIYQYDMQNDEIECLYSSEEDEPKDKILYANIVKYNENLICIPFHLKNFLIYNLDTKSINKIDIGNEFRLNEKKIDSFFGAHIYDKYLIVWGYTLKCIIKIDLEEKTFIKAIDLNDILSDSDDVIKLARKGVAIESKIYIPSWEENAIIEFDMQNDEVEVIKLNGVKSGFSDICYDGEHLWLISNKFCDIVRYDINNREVKMYSDFPDGFSEDNRYNGLSYIFYVNEKIWCLYRKANMFTVIDKVTGKMSSVHKLNALINEKKLDYYRLAKLIGDDIIIAYSGCDVYVVYNTLNDTVNIYDGLKVNVLDENKKESLFNMRQKRLSDFKEYRMSENDFGGLNNVLDMLVNNDTYSKQQVEAYKSFLISSGGNVGNNIHEYIKRKVK